MLFLDSHLVAVYGYKQPLKEIKKKALFVNKFWKKQMLCNVDFCNTYILKNCTYNPDVVPDFRVL